MRDVKAKDYWKRIYANPRQFRNYVKKIQLTNDEGYITDISLQPGMSIICGLNGAGKSSIIASIKSILGFKDESIVSKNKFSGKITADMVIDGEIVEVSPSSPAIENGLNEDLIVYIDFDQALDCLKLWEQSNLEELLESEDDNPFSDEQLAELSWLVGKKYSECVSIEIAPDEVAETEDKLLCFKPVFFSVTKDNLSYNSTQMGLGEHFAIYMYYVICGMPSNSILLIEEPESNVSILTQHHLMDFLAKNIAEKHISVVISSHSPHITNVVKNKNIVIVGNTMGLIVAHTPESAFDANKYLGIKYQLSTASIATIYVEDYIARLFLQTLLIEELPTLVKLVDVVSVGGDSRITERLSFDDSAYMKHKLIGVYDGDLKGRLDSALLKWPCAFLPVDECVEKEIISFLGDQYNIRQLCESLQLDFYAFILAWDKNRSEDHHDFFLNLCRDLKIEHDSFIRTFYMLWRNGEKKDEIDDFSKQICSLITGQEQDLLLEDQMTAMV